METAAPPCFYALRSLCHGDREDFRRVAATGLASSPQCWGPGSVYRTLVPLWRTAARLGTRETGKQPHQRTWRSRMAAIVAASGSWFEPMPYWAAVHVGPHRERLAERALPRRLPVGARVRILGGPFRDHLGLCAVGSGNGG